ncbi:N-acetyltransferase [Vibrio sp. T187]|uniref:GNAT family N-acetyltransferase n=1 Tax=Vibrio TaxID=662 RepID=UPI0010C97811|nr:MULTISPECIES: GNAT family N-acetyltransferase [Vibrio]MBW3695387.1 N-acetyltransferase [Vibrio sp. T187]
MKIHTRDAQESDYEFLFHLKKAAEYDAIKAVFGWDEPTQWCIHQQEWQEERPTIIECDDQPIGSFLLQRFDTHLYFGRFFLLPDFHGQGVGSGILQNVIEQSETAQLDIKLCYLVGNRVGSLYQRYGFEVTSQDSQFIHMLRQPKS